LLVMIFGKKKRMIDVRELQRRGVVRIPRENVVVPTDRDGFVEFGGSGSSEGPGVSSSTSSDSSSSNSEFFGFMGSGSSGSSASSDSFPSSSDGYDKREVDEKIAELDNKIYKLEQRIELLERKLDVGGPSASSSDVSDSNVGVMGW